ncbi:MAG: NAD-dependent epimerase/dehydratase family protein [Solirubrobacterales bacterium]
MKYVVTGGSGYIGTRLTELLVERDETERIVNLDVRAPEVPWPKTAFVQGDVRDRAAMRELLTGERPDALVHLAFLLDPIHDEARMYDIDVNGTQAVLEAASEARTEQVLVASSASAYGAFPDNPVPIAEDHPVRGQPDFSYARDKAEADRVCQLWAADHPDRVMTIVRPTIVFGPNVDNYISRAWENNTFFPVMDGVEADLQLVHEDDVVTAIASLLDAREGGAFNVAADGTMKWRESAELIGTRVREMKFRTVYRIYSWMWRLHAPRVESPAGNLHFLHHPWVVSNEKLKSATGWEPTHDTRAVFEQTMRAKGLIPGGPEPAATLRVPGA